MERSGPFIRTYTGGKFYFNDVRPEDINIEDIAHALSINARFGGHTTRHYSVAEHSISCAVMLAGTENEFAALIHDRAEAFMVDLPRPLKYLPEMGFYRKLESRVEQISGPVLGLSKYDHAAVKSADNIMLGIEAHLLMRVLPGEDPDWDKYVIPALAHPMYKDLEWSILNPPKDVRRDFLDYFYFLNGEKKAA